MMMNVGRSILFGLSTLIIVPTLSILSFGLLLGAILTIIIGTLRTMGMEAFQMNLTPGIEVPTWLSLPFAFFLAAVLVGVAYISWRLLKKYTALLR